MRDGFLEALYAKMQYNRDIFLVSADFGAPKLDDIKSHFSDRFINVGIAEQNLINISMGLALEGFTVYTYAIAPFLTMRAYEQIRVNLSLHAQVKELNVNLVGVGAGISYDVTGPTHHCLEDLSIMRVLPHFTVISPSDWKLAEACVDYTLTEKKPKYLRFDAKPLPQIYPNAAPGAFSDGFIEIARADCVCFVTTGFMTHKALGVIEKLKQEGLSVGIVDVVLLKPVHGEKLYDSLKHYEHIITLEEGFVGKGGLDCLIDNLYNSRGSRTELTHLGFPDRYTFEMGSREELYALNGLDDESIISLTKRIFDKRGR